MKKYISNFDKIYSGVKKRSNCLHKKVKPLGLQDDGEGGKIELVNCDICHTTLTKDFEFKLAKVPVIYYEKLRNYNKEGI